MSLDISYEYFNNLLKMQSTKFTKTPLNALIDSLIQKGVITSDRVNKVMRKVDRADFCPNNFQNSAYEDSPQSINYGATISAPHMHAYCLVFSLIT